jgi:hypothetical protein
MAAINSDAKKPRKITPAAATRKRGNIADAAAAGSRSELGPDVYVRDASHYELNPAPLNKHDSEPDSGHDGEPDSGHDGQQEAGR